MGGELWLCLLVWLVVLVRESVSLQEKNSREEIQSRVALGGMVKRPAVSNSAGRKLGGLSTWDLTWR
jgi:hypothetical protein